MNNTKISIASVCKPIGLLLLAAIIAVSCQKNHTGSGPGDSISALAIGHVAPSSPEYVIKINGVKVLQQALRYGSYLNYGTLQSGKQEFSISEKGSMEVLARSAYQLKPQTYYSLYLADSSKKPVFILSEDDLSMPAAGKAKIRFVNLSPDAGNLDLSVSGQTKALFSNTAYRTSTEFIEIDPSAGIKLEITENGKADVLSASTIKIDKDRVYTIWARGLKANTDSTKLGVRLILNR